MRLGKEVVGLSQMSGSANDTLVMKRSIPLGKIGAAEKWLNCMAENGHVLSKVEGRNFWFTSEEPKKLHFFVLSPEKGANSSSWIYYEFLEKGGTKIPHLGSSFMSPNLILMISDDKYQENPSLYSYYFRHRNHRLLHRFVTNIAASAVMFAMSILLIGASITFLFPLLYIAMGSFIIGCVNTVMLIEFCRYIRSANLPLAWKRPRRPGY